MATYTKVSDLSAASALDGTEQLLAVQTAGSVYVTPDQIHEYAPAGITATSSIIGEHIFDEDSELDYSASISDAMAAATVTFSELPANTVEILVYYYFADNLHPYGSTGNGPAAGHKIFIFRIRLQTPELILWLALRGSRRAIILFMYHR